MSFSPPKETKFAESDQEARRGEGVYWTLDVTNWTTGTVADATISIYKDADESDVTSTWTTTATCTVSDQTVTTPKISVPSNAAVGKYLVTIEFNVTGGPYEPGRPWTWIIVYE